MEKDIRINVTILISEKNGVHVLGTREREDGESRVSRTIPTAYISALNDPEEMMELVNEVIEDTVSTLIVNN